MRYDFSTNEYVLNRVDGSEYRWDDLFPGIVQDFWTNDPTIWDLENKVTWDEIAPSLQELIIRKIRFNDLHKSLQDRIIDDETNIAANTNAINNEINTRIAKDKILQDQVDDLKRRMTAAEKRITDLEARMDEAERQIGLLWEEIRKLWDYVHENRSRIEYLEGKLEETEDDLESTKSKVTNLCSINFANENSTEIAVGGGTWQCPTDSWVQLMTHGKGVSEVFLIERNGTPMNSSITLHDGEYSVADTMYLPLAAGDVIESRKISGYGEPVRIRWYPL